MSLTPEQRDEVLLRIMRQESRWLGRTGSAETLTRGGYIEAMRHCRDVVHALTRDDGQGPDESRPSRQPSR